MSKFEVNGTDLNDIFTSQTNTENTNYFNTLNIDIGKGYKSINSITSFPVQHSDVKYSFNSVNLASFFLPKSEQLTAQSQTTYNIPSWCRTIKCIIMGGGGGGHGNYGGGGGGGGMLYAHITKTESGTTLQYSVGIFGYSRSTPETGQAAGPGGNSIITYSGTEYIAYGGGGGFDVGGNGGGTSGNGLFNVNGSIGTAGGAGNGMNNSIPVRYYSSSNGGSIAGDNVADFYGRGGGYNDDNYGYDGQYGYIRILLCV